MRKGFFNFTADMGYLTPRINRLKTFRARLSKIGMDAVFKNEDAIIQHYQVNQVGSNLKVGARKNEVKIGWYHPATQDIWVESEHYIPELDKSWGNDYYMYWSGQFFAQMKIAQVGKREYTVYSSVSYFGKLLEKYGDIMTFTVRTREFVEKSYIKPHIDKELSKLLQSIT